MKLILMLARSFGMKIEDVVIYDLAKLWKHSGRKVMQIPRTAIKDN